MKVYSLVNIFIVLSLCITVAGADTTYGRCSFKLSQIKESNFKDAVDNAKLCREGEDKCIITWIYSFDELSFTSNLPNSELLKDNDRSIEKFGNSVLNVSGERRNFSIEKGAGPKTVNGLLNLGNTKGIFIICTISNNIINEQMEPECENFINNQHPKDKKKDQCIAM